MADLKTQKFTHFQNAAEQKGGGEGTDKRNEVGGNNL